MLSTPNDRFYTLGRMAHHRVGHSKAWRKSCWATVIAFSVPLTVLPMQVTIAADKADDQDIAQRDQKFIDGEQKKLKTKVEQLLRRRRGDFCVIALLETQWRELVTRTYRTVEPSGVASNDNRIGREGPPSGAGSRRTSR
jgi:hypothetical protein